MAHSRRRPASSASSAFLLLALILGIVLCFLSVPASAQESASSPPDLICHTDNPAECYPRVFVPTDEFQVIRDDQEIPKGLHVRLNMETGVKEAKINVPDEIDPALEGLPVEQAMLVVEPQEADEEIIPKIPKGAPEYDQAGAIKGPQVEAKFFRDAMDMLKTGDVAEGKTYDGLMDDLEELSHDLYYGLKIAEDTDVVKSLFCLMGGRGNDGKYALADGVVARDQQAAAILAGCLQNNPTSLAEVVKHWKGIKEHPCGSAAKVQDVLYQTLAPGDKTHSAALASALKVKVSAVNSLIKDPAIRDEFLASGGMRQLQQILLPEGKEWAAAQRKVGQLALDNFLDEDMGAKLGLWPRQAKISDKECASSPLGLEEGCWDYHVARIMKANKADKGHWSRDLHSRLAKARKEGPPASMRHDEL